MYQEDLCCACRSLEANNISVQLAAQQGFPTVFRTEVGLKLTFSGGQHATVCEIQYIV